MSRHRLLSMSIAGRWHDRARRSHAAIDSDATRLSDAVWNRLHVGNGGAVGAARLADRANGIRSYDRAHVLTGCWLSLDCARSLLGFSDPQSCALMHLPTGFVVGRVHGLRYR